MRNWLLGGVATAIIASGGLALTQSAASQPAPAGTLSEDRAPPPSAGPERGGPDERMHEREMAMREGGWHQRGRMLRRLRQFGLIYPAQDRNLNAGDVQKIAEAFLLWNGNHTWKVVNVQDQGERIAFSFATQDGGAIASFTIDRHTGRVERTG